jgi:tagatose 6-phosphate kinase
VILCAGLSPAWQQVLVFERLRPGEVNRATDVRRFPAGKVINAARAAHRLGLRGLGGPSRALTILGGSTGEELRRAAEEEGIDLAIVPSAAPTRVCTTVVSDADGGVTELVEEAAPIPEDEILRFFSRFREEAAAARIAVLIGSLPRGAPADFYRSLLRDAKVPVVLDARGPEMLAALEERPLVVKPNREELSKTFGRPLASEDDLREAMVDLGRRGARWVLITDGPRPALVHGEGKFYRFHPPRVEAVSPIGSGDCLAAGIACSLAKGTDMVEAIRMGIAAGAENATRLRSADIEGTLTLKLRDQVRVEEWR